ncbi:hypothetical protein JX265_009296 [Neoarthrinium moseri]|uniref:Rhodopsin domain-containing protein n=1 Tax=Neoarthrinium moseri TaxID=1658444 RepID=A0A9P9WG73_9PEZI|nr:hypothetical protein JX265_009296 [Neoarthrinium moseri]
MTDSAEPLGAAPPPPGVVPDFDNPADAGFLADRAGLLTFASLATVFFILRCYVKIFISPRMMAEDWTFMIAWASLIAFISTVLMMTHYGDGHHIWEITKEEFTTLRKWLYIRSLIFGPASYFTKVTLLLIIARVFSVREQISRAIYIYIWVLLICFLPIQVMKTAICTPIRGFWDLSVHNARCLDHRHLFVADRSLSIITDILILVIPIVVTWSMNVPIRKKIKIAVLLGAGGIATAINCFQLWKVVLYARSDDATSDMVVLDLTITAELTIGLMCACLPPINLLLQRLRSAKADCNMPHPEKRALWKLGRLERSHKGVSSTWGDSVITRRGTTYDDMSDVDVEMAMLTGRPLTVASADASKHGSNMNRSLNSLDRRTEGWLSSDIQREELTPSGILVPDRIWDGLTIDRVGPPRIVSEHQ